MIFALRARPPRTKTAALFAGTEGLLVLIYAKMFNYWIIISRFWRLSTEKLGVFCFSEKSAGNGALSFPVLSLFQEAVHFTASFVWHTLYLSLLLYLYLFLFLYLYLYLAAAGH